MNIFNLGQVEINLKIKIRHLSLSYAGLKILKENVSFKIDFQRYNEIRRGLFFFKKSHSLSHREEWVSNTTVKTIN